MHHPQRGWELRKPEYPRALDSGRGIVSISAADWPSSGHHNINCLGEIIGPELAALWDLPCGTLVKLRRRLEDVPRVVVRVWDSEAEILGAVNRWIPETPKYIGRWGQDAVHTYTPGKPLSWVCHPGRLPGRDHLHRIAGFFAELAAVDTRTFPPLPADWPVGGDSAGFLRQLMRLTEHQIWAPNQREFGWLFDALGVPRYGMRRLERILHRRIRHMASRPFSLLHTDIHRDNLIVRPDGSLFLLDWELALVGDPLHDLAIHLVRMKYPDQRAEDTVIGLWEESVGEVSPESLVGREQDLPLYVAFERTQSVYPDIIRAARGIRSDVSAEAMARAVGDVENAIALAREGLGMEQVPDARRIATALNTWRRRKSSLYHRSR